MADEKLPPLTDVERRRTCGKCRGTGTIEWLDGGSIGKKKQAPCPVCGYKSIIHDGPEHSGGTSDE